MLGDQAKKLATQAAATRERIDLENPDPVKYRREQEALLAEGEDGEGI